MGWALLGLVVFNSLGPMLMTSPSVRWALIAGVGTAIGLTIVVLTRVGHVTAAAWFLTVSIWAFSTSAELTAGGLSAPSVSLQIVFVLTAGLALGWRVGAGAAVVSAVTVVAMAWIEAEGWLPAPAVAHTPLSRAWSIVGYVSVVLVIVAIVTLDMRRSRDEALRELDQRRAAESFLGAVVSSAPGVFYALDHRGHFVRWNRELETIVGRTSLAGLRLAEVVDERDRATVEEGIARALREGAAELEARLLTVEGPRRYALTGHLVEGVGVRTMVGFGLDITELRDAEAEVRALNQDLEARVAERTEQLEEALRALESFSYSVSHDLRAPLRAINGYATIIETDYSASLDDEGRRELERIRDNTQRMAQLIDDLLSFSRPGRHQLQHEVLDMEALVCAVFEEAVPPERRETVDFEVAPLPAAWGDPAMLRQVWVNLLENALKFSRGRERPRIRVDGQAADGQVAYSVHDNGVGFDRQYGERLFQVFERLHGSDYEGTGIGLAICKRIVEAHGGRMWCASQPGAGSMFSFSLPEGNGAGREPLTGA
jgi:PAS domain S-box-containing protein